MTTLRTALVVLVVLVSGCSALAPSPTLPGTSMSLVTAPAYSMPPGAISACAAAALNPVVVSRDGDHLIFLNTASKAPVAVIWPHGFTARLVNGKGELLDPSGAVIGVEGDTLSDLGGGIGSDSDAFFVCMIGNRIYP
jgi:hypothetical protein